MADLVERLKAWPNGVYSVPGDKQLMSEAAAEIEKLRRDLAAAYLDANCQAFRKIEAVQGEQDVQRALAAANAKVAQLGDMHFRICANAKRVDTHGTGALNDIVAPYLIDEARAIADGGAQ